MLKEEYEDHIRTRAHAIWESEGRPHGRDADHWLRARQELEQDDALKGHPGNTTPGQVGSTSGEGLVGSMDADAEDDPQRMGVDDVSAEPITSPKDNRPTTGKSKLVGS